MGEKAKQPDGASREGRDDYLAVVAELLPDDGYDPTPLVRRAFLRHPGFWLARAGAFAVTAGVGATLVEALPMGPVLAGMASLGFAFLVPVWFASALGPTRDLLADDRPLHVGDQLLRWGGRLPSLVATLGLHVLPACLAGGLLPPTHGATPVVMGLAVMVGCVNWFYAASEVLLTGADAVTGTGRALRLSVFGVPRRVLAFFREFRLRHLLRAPMGERRLASTLVIGFFLTYAAAGLGVALEIGMIQGLGLPPAPWGVLAGLLGLLTAALAADYTTAQFGGQYLAFMADRRRKGEPVTLPDPTTETRVLLG